MRVLAGSTVAHLKPCLSQGSYKAVSCTCLLWARLHLQFNISVLQFLVLLSSFLLINSASNEPGHLAAAVCGSPKQIISHQSDSSRENCAILIQNPKQWELGRSGPRLLHMETSQRRRLCFTLNHHPPESLDRWFTERKKRFHSATGILFD